MTTQTLYNQLLEGKISEPKFLYEVRRDERLPMITKFNSLKDTIQILKTRGVITEDRYKKEKNPEFPKPEYKTIDMVSPYEYAKGINYELDLLDISVGQNMPKDTEVLDAQKKVLKNLTSDNYYYTKKINALNNNTF